MLQGEKGAGAAQVVVGGLTLYVCYTALYRLFWHPLAKYPGPLLAKLTGFYMVWHALCAQNTFVRHSLHQKYGHVVRVGPNELSFSDSSSIKDIYGQSSNPCPKASFFYRGFTITGTESVFSTIDRNVHARMRRLLSHGFSQNGVLQFEGDIKRHIGRYLSRIQESRSQPVEFHDLTHHLFVDITSELSFGKSFDSLNGTPNQGAKDIATYFEICPVFGVFPLARYLPFGIFRAAYDAQPRIVRAAQQWIDDFRTRLRAGTTDGGLLRLMMQPKDNETNESFSEEELIENAIIFIIAGSDTSATTLLYILYEVGRRPDMQARLVEEIRGAFPNATELPDFDTATRLPYLNNVLQEVLRLRGPLNTVSPRVSPGKTIGGAYIPAGTLVSNLPYTTHRDPSVFADPENFEPSRWDNDTAEMKAMHRPFNTGPRSCVGMHLARVQIILAVCALYQCFDLTLDPSMDDDLMALRDVGLMSPIGKTLKIRVTRH